MNHLGDSPAPRAHGIRESMRVSPSPLNIVHRASGDPRREQHLGPYCIESLIDEDEEGGITAYRVTIAPHEETSVSLHRRAEELYYVLSGCGMAVLNGQPHPIAAGEVLRLPPGTTHGFRTAGEPLEMLNIHAPGSRPNRDVFFPNGPPPEGFTPTGL